MVCRTPGPEEEFISSVSLFILFYSGGGGSSKAKKDRDEKSWLFAAPIQSTIEEWTKR